MIPAISYRRLVPLDDLEQHNSGQLGAGITPEAYCGLAHHDTLLVRLDLGVERRARRDIWCQRTDVRQTRDDSIESIVQLVLRSDLGALIKAQHDPGEDGVISSRHEDVRQSRYDGLPGRGKHVCIEDVGVADDKIGR
jgi:hypothetical protein